MLWRGRGVTQALGNEGGTSNLQGRDKRDSELQLGREANALVWHPSHPDQLVTSAADNLIK